MRWRDLDVRERRIVRGGAVVLLLGVCTRSGVLPYLDRLERARGRLAHEESLFARERSMLRESSDARRAFDALAAHAQADAPRLLQGGAVASVQAGLAGALDAAAEVAEVQITRVDPMPMRPAGSGLAAVSVRVEGESDTEGLLTLLAAFESSPRLLHASELEVRTRRAEAGLDGAVSASSVVFRLVLTGYVLAGTSQSRERAVGTRRITTEFSGEAP